MTESFALDPFTLATDGVLRPVSDDPADGYCPGLFSLASGGAWYIPEPVVLEAGLADPYVGPSRFKEPFDRGYYLWKYGKNAKQAGDFAKQPTLPRSLVEQALLKQLPVMDAIVESRRLQESPAERDQLELELYIAELTRELESELLTALRFERAEIKRQQALIDALEENRVAARDALLLVIDRRRRRNNEIAAAAAIDFYF